MNRFASLLVTAREVRRRIWASLPLPIRYAEVLYRLGGTGSDAFGTGMYGIFLERGIEGMPDINGVPALEWVAKHGVNVNRLPRSYGAEFGARVFKNLVGRFKNPVFVQDLMSEIYTEFKDTKAKHLDGKSRSYAEHYVERALINTGFNIVKKKTETLDSSMTKKRDEPGPSFVDRAPAEETFEMSTRDVLKFLNKSSVRRRLQRAHPSAEQYLRLHLIEGYQDVEILGDVAHGVPSMLDHPYNDEGGPLKPAAWGKFKKRIYQALRAEYEDEMAV